MMQSPEATALAQAATEAAQKRLKANRVPRPTPNDQIDVERLLSILRPMVSRWLKDEYRGTQDAWQRLARELTRE